MRRNAARTFGLALVAAALLLIAQTGNAGAAGSGPTLKAKAWWWKAQQLPAGTIPPPPNVKSGQLSVQSDPSGAAAFSAVRYELGSGSSAGMLTLKLGADGATNGDSAAVRACRTGSAWSPAEAGPWSAAPHVDTDSCVNGTKGSDGTAWTFNTATLQTGTILDIAIIPGPDPESNQFGTWSLTFDPPADNSLATTAGSSSGGSTASSFTPSTLSSPSPVGSTSGATAPSGGGIRPPATPSVPTGLPSDKVGQTATSPQNQQASQAALNTALTPTSNNDKPNKTAGYIVLAIAVAVGLYAYREDNLMARNGGALPGEPAEEGGLGRFTKPRTGRPPALT